MEASHAVGAMASAHSTTRRGLLAGAGAVGAASALLSGCTGEDNLSVRPYPDTERSGDDLPRKQLVRLGPDTRVRLSFPGGGGYGRPTARPVEAVLSDVVNGYITIDAARTAYGVGIDYVGRADALVRPPDTYRVDQERTTALRADLADKSGKS